MKIVVHVHIYMYTCTVELRSFVTCAHACILEL